MKCGREDNSTVPTNNSEEAYWPLAPNYLQIAYKFTKKTPSTSWCCFNLLEAIGVYSDVLVSFGSQWLIYIFTMDAVSVIKKLLIFYQSSQTWIFFHLFLSYTLSSLLLCALNVMGWARTGYDLCVINANFLGPRGNFLVRSSHISKALHRDTHNYLPFSPAFMLSILCKMLGSWRPLTATLFKWRWHKMLHFYKNTRCQTLICLWHKYNPCNWCAGFLAMGSPSWSLFGFNVDSEMKNPSKRKIICLLLMHSHAQSVGVCTMHRNEIEYRDLQFERY